MKLLRGEQEEERRQEKLCGTIHELYMPLLSSQVRTNWIKEDCGRQIQRQMDDLIAIFFKFINFMKALAWKM